MEEEEEEEEEGFKIKLQKSEVGGKQMRRNSSLIFLSLILLLSIMADAVAGEPTAAAAAAAVHIVYTEKPEHEEPESFHIRTLTSVLGSEEAAKEAILYSYKTAASGFSAKLTPEQVSQISKEPGVLQVVPSRTYQLHSGPNRVN